MTQQELALVTGANGNLGRAVVNVLAARGQQVVRILRDRALAGPDDQLVAPLDLLSTSSCETLLSTVEARFGAPQVAVHTVGTFTWTGSIAGAELDAFRSIYETNVLTTVAFLRAVVPVMRRAGYGRIAVIASSAALHAVSGVSAYSASKAAQLRIVESVAAELRGSGVTINAVLPGVMDTPQNRAAMPGADTSRWVSPREVADVVAHLTSREAASISGADIVVGEG